MATQTTPKTVQHQWYEGVLTKSAIYMRDAEPKAGNAQHDEVLHDTNKARRTECERNAGQEAKLLMCSGGGEGFWRPCVTQSH